MLLYSFHQICFGIPDEGLKLLIAALADDPQGTAEIQAEHFHKALGVDLVVVVPHNNIIGTGSGQGHEMLDILNRAQTNGKFQHFSPPLNYTNLIILCIIKEWSNRVLPLYLKL